MRAAVECDSESGRAELGVVSGEAMVTNAAHGYRVYIGRITIAVTVVVRQSTISRCPDVDVAFTISSLESDNSYHEHFAVRMVWIVGCLKLRGRDATLLQALLSCNYQADITTRLHHLFRLDDNKYTANCEQA